MKKLRLKLALKCVNFGLYIMRLEPTEQRDMIDHDNITKLFLLKQSIEKDLAQ